MKPLDNRIAVVAGATRGAGRGIAAMLGEAGATVYCTGRSVSGSPGMEGRPETIEESAEMVTARGGKGIWAQVDHLDERQVQALFERVWSEQGRLDLLVNDIWGGDPLAQWGTPFWELDISRGLAMLQTGLHTHLITARYAAPYMIRQGHGLIIEMTDGDSAAYRGNLFYDLVKASVIRIAYGMSVELKPHGVTALAVTPGFLRSEAVLDHFGVTEANWRDGSAKEPTFVFSETPFFVGKAVARLAADPSVNQRAGCVYGSWDLAEEYGFDDVDGRRPHWGRDFAAWQREHPDPKG